MKIRANVPASVKPEAVAEPAKTVAARKSLSAIATAAAVKTIAAQSATPNTPVTQRHPLLEKFGEALGMGLGVVVTEALRAIPSWNAPVLGADGKPVAEVPGATRTGGHDILKRHEEVVGPQVAALVAKMPADAVHDLLAGFAQGATAAPGTSYRIDSAIADAFEDF